MPQTAPETKGTYISEWNTMGAEMTAIGEILRLLIDDLRITKTRNNARLEIYLANLWALYMSYIGINKDPRLNKKFKKIEKGLNHVQGCVNDWLNLPPRSPEKNKFQWEIAHKLYLIHEKLIKYKQESGIGIARKFKMSDTRRMKKQAGIE